MAKANIKRALATEKIGSFGGICHGLSEARDKSGSFRAYDICNFRILPSGSIEKRSGFAPLMTLPGEPRAFWSGYLDGDELSFALVGSAVYSIDFSSQSANLIGTIDTSVGRAEFFFYRGRLYLKDEEELYRYDGLDFETFSGYVPLYGLNWEPRYGNNVNEPVNFLSDKIRIHYHVSKSTDYFYVGIKCSEVLSLKWEGREYIDKVIFAEDGMSFSLDTIAFPNDSDVVAVLRLDPGEYRRGEMMSACRATVYGGDDDGRVILYGGSAPSLLYTSRYVSRQSYLESLAADPASTDVYFPTDDVFSVTDGRYPVVSMCRHYDRLLVFTERETWMADFTKSAEAPRFIPINSSIGCLSEGGAVLGANSPYSVSEGGIYRWTSNDDERDECNAVCVSTEIGDMLDESFFSHAQSFYLRKRGEVWFSDPDSDEQRVLIYSIPRGQWFSFDGIPVDTFFQYKGDVGMVYGKYIFAFSDDNLVDTACDGKTQSNIEAYYESSLTDFGIEERTKHLKRILVKADCDGDSFDVILSGDRGGTKQVKVKERKVEGEKYSTYLDARVNIGRFREMNFTLRSSGEGRTKVRSIMLVASK